MHDLWLAAFLPANQTPGLKLFVNLLTDMDFKVGISQQSGPSVAANVLVKFQSNWKS